MGDKLMASGQADNAKQNGLMGNLRAAWASKKQARELNDYADQNRRERRDRGVVGTYQTKKQKHGKHAGKAVPPPPKGADHQGNFHSQRGHKILQQRSRRRLAQVAALRESGRRGRLQQAAK